MEAAPKPSPWRDRARRLLQGLVILHLIASVGVIGILLFGESTRPSFVLLYAPRLPFLVAAVVATLVALKLEFRGPKVDPHRTGFCGALRQRRLTVAETVLTLILLFPVMGLHIGLSRHAQEPLRLLTYNIYFGRLSREALVNEIALAPADIVVLQAANGSFGDRLRQRFPDRTMRQDGEFVIVTRLRIREAELGPTLAGDTPAMYMRYVLETPRGPLEVYNVHPFSARHALFGDDRTEDVTRREAQVAAIVEAARSAGAPFVIAGDFNLPEMSGIARRHLGKLNDAFADVGVGFGYTFPAKYPWMRIDRVLAGPAIRFTNIDVAKRGASDHRSVSVEFEIVDR